MLRDGGPDVVGRDREFAVLDGFLQADDSPGAVVLSGGPGIGKTTLWEAGIQAAKARGMRVLTARGSGADAQLSFAALIDLLDGVDREEFSGLPAPQLHALEVALLRAEPTGAPPAPHAIALGFLNGLRGFASHGPLVIAIDDVQWLDAPSAEVLAFAAPRLEGRPVAFLLAKRPGRLGALERALEPANRVDVGPLSLGAIRRLLSQRLGLSLPRSLLRRLVDSTLGNPLFALELGRMLAEDGLPAIGEELPVPDAVEDLLGTRVGRLPSSVQRLLLAVSLSADLRTSQLAAIGDTPAVDDAVDAGLLVVDGERVRPSHPLLAAAAKKHSRAQERRELHLALAGVVADEELRARHLALAAQRPDEELAATLVQAAAAAAARGARQDAVELAEHALRLTPEASPERAERLLTLAGHLETAGELQRVTDLLMPELDSLPAGAARARAWLILSEAGAVRSIADFERHLEMALAESQDDPGLRAHVLAKMSDKGVERIREAEARALEALEAAPLAGPDVERLALYGLGWARALSGRPIDDVCERFHAVSSAAAYIIKSPERVAGQRLVWRGEIDRARLTFTRLLSLADEQGEPTSYAMQRLHLCELELRVGAWEAASGLLDEWAESADRDLLVPPHYERCRALLYAGRGSAAEAETWAAETIARAEAMGIPWELLEARRARGIAALLVHEPARAVESLRAVWEHTEREGVDEPGVFPVAPDLIEALVELGELDEARAVTARLRLLAEQQEHPWGLATASRGEALVRLASQADEEAAAAGLEHAAGAYADLGLRFDHARTLLLLGRAQRRRKKWAAARRALEQAAAAFDEMGSPGWAEQARSELERVGARRPSATGELTPAERRVVELAAQGLANKEIARTLFVGVHTVEVHLSHAYAKLGVRSRAQLAGRLAADA